MSQPFMSGQTGAGEGNAVLTPAATTRCSASAKAWRAGSNRPRAARPVAGAGCTCCPPSPCGIHSPRWKTCVGGGDGGECPDG